MIDNLKDFLISNEELANMEEQLRQTMQQSLQQSDRLRTYMQLMIIVRQGCEALRALDTQQFLTQLKEELETRAKRSREEVDQLIVTTRDQVEGLGEKADALQKELKVRIDKVNDVAEGLGDMANDADLTRYREDAARLLSDLEQRIASLVELRNSKSFAELNAMATQIER